MWKKKIIVFALLIFCTVVVSNNQIQLADYAEGKKTVELYGIEIEETNY